MILPQSRRSIVPHYFVLLLLVLSVCVSKAQDWVPQTSGSSVLLHDVSFVENHGWAVGRLGTILHTTDGGQTWVPQISGTTEHLHSVSFVDSLTGWAVGEQDVSLGVSTVLHTTDGGNAWVGQLAPPGDYFECLFISNTSGWLFGGGGRILHTTNSGNTWTVQRQAKNQLLFGVHFLDDNTGYVAGQTIAFPRTAVLLSTTNGGETWNEAAVGDFRGLQSVHFKDYSNGWAVGWLGEMIRTTDGGSTWFRQESGRTDELLFSVYFNTPLSGWVVGGESGCQLVDCDSLMGEQTIMLRTTDGGESWMVFPSPVGGQLLETLHFTSPDTGWIVGGSPILGTVLHTTNGSAGVLILPSAVVLVSPGENVVVDADSVMLRWAEGEPQVDRYWLELGTDSLLAGAVVDSTVTDTVRTVFSLIDGTTYFWRVRAHNGAGWGPFSSAGRFSVELPASIPLSVELINPADGAQVESSPVTFRWMRQESESADSLRYHVQVAGDSLFAGLLEHDATLVDTTYQVDSMGSGTRYYWRVRGVNVGGGGPWSQVFYFITLPPVPSVVGLVSPGQDSVVTVDDVVLRWNRSKPQVDRYWVEYGCDSLFTGSAMDSTVTDTVLATVPLINDTSYYWRVRAHNQAGWGPVSNVSRFSVALPAKHLPAPLLVAPVDGAVDEPVPVSLIWNSSAATPENRFSSPGKQRLEVLTQGNEKPSLAVPASLKGDPPVTAAGDTVRYYLQISESPTFDTVVLEDSVDSDTTHQAGSLGFATQYYWRIRATSPTGESPWSTSRGFTTAPPPISCSELALFRSQCLTGSRIRITVLMQNSSHAGKSLTATIDDVPHTLVVGTNGRAQIVVRSTPGSHVVALTSPPGCFSPITVSCAGAFASEELEGTNLFEVLDPEQNGSFIAEELPKVTALLGSYPNPFNPRTAIAFELATGGFVELRVYDLLGREVATLVNAILPPGRHIRHWDGSNFSSGVYFYHFRVGNLSETRKLILMK